MNPIEPPAEKLDGAKVFNQIAKLIPTLGGWTSIPKAQTFAALIMAYRPLVSLELGCWCGRGALSLALAHKEIGRGLVYAIDAWSAEASIEGQVHEADRKHWNNQPEHEAAYQSVLANVQKLNLDHCIRVIRSKSEDVDPPKNVGLAIIDANHGDGAILDVQRYAPHVVPGGFVFLDDLDWSGGAVRRAEARLKSMGFRELYPIETGALYQKM